MPLALEVLAGALGVAAFAVVVYAGLAGNQTATANLAPTAIFVLFWVGVPCASVLLGDVFAAFSPWRATGRATGWVGGAGRGRGAARRRSPIPSGSAAGRRRSAILAFAWVELVYVDRDRPEPPRGARARLRRR